MNKLPYIIVILGILAAAVYASIFIVNEREQAIVLRFGEIKRVVREPGANFKVPFLDNVQVLEDRILKLELEDIAYRILFSRPPTDQELQLGMQFIEAQGFRNYIHTLLCLNEFIHPN